MNSEYYYNIYCAKNQWEQAILHGDQISVDTYAKKAQTAVPPALFRVLYPINFRPCRIIMPCG